MMVVKFPFLFGQQLKDFLLNPTLLCLHIH